MKAKVYVDVKVDFDTDGNMRRENLYGKMVADMK